MARRFAAALTAALLPVVGQATTPAAPAGTSCANLAALTIPNITIKSSNSIPAGPFAPTSAATPMTLPAFCRVEAHGAADQRFGHQVRSLDSPGRRVERQVPGRRQRRLLGAIGYAAMATACAAATPSRAPTPATPATT
jgi:hypothetical protein